jgi:hypothetical protein
MCYAVEIHHNEENDVSVIYIRAAQTTAGNIAYVQDQWARFEKGKPPADFEHDKDESNFKGYVSEKGILGGEAGRRATSAV